MRFLAALLALASVPFAVSIAIPQDITNLCESPKVISQTFIGENEEVKVEALQCANALEIQKRETLPVNVCGATCAYDVTVVLVLSCLLFDRRYQLLHPFWWRSRPE